MFSSDWPSNVMSHLHHLSSSQICCCFAAKGSQTPLWWHLWKGMRPSGSRKAGHQGDGWAQGGCQVNETCHTSSRPNSSHTVSHPPHCLLPLSATFTFTLSSFLLPAVKSVCPILWKEQTWRTIKHWPLLTTVCNSTLAGSVSQVILWICPCYSVISSDQFLELRKYKVLLKEQTELDLLPSNRLEPNRIDKEIS